MKLTHRVVALTTACLLGPGFAAAQTPAGKGTAETPFALAVNLHRDAAGDLLPTGAIGQLGSGKLRQLRPKLCFSPDGKRLLSWSEQDSSIRVWDATTGQEIQRIVHYSNLTISNIAFSPDHKTLAIACKHGVTFLLDAGTAKVLHRLQVEPADTNPFTYQVTYAPDGKTLAISNGLTDIYLWNVATGKPTGRLVAPPKPVPMSAGPLTYSADGKQLLGAGGLWDVAKGQLLWSPASDNIAVQWMTTSADHRQVAVFTSKGGLQLRDRATDTLLHDFLGIKFVGARNMPSMLRFSPDGRVLAGLSWSRALHLWDVASGKLLKEFPPEADWAPFALAFAPDSKTLAFVRGNSHIVLWDVAGGKERLAQPGYHGELQAVALSPNGRWLAVKPKTGALALWNLTTRQALSYVIKDEQSNGGFAFTPDSTALATSGKDVLHFWEMASGKNLYQLPHNARPGPLAFAPGGKVLATAVTDRSPVTLLDAVTGKPWHTLVHDKPDRDLRGVQALVFSPDGYTLAVVHDGKVVLWSWRSKEILHAHKSPPGSTVSFSPDGRTVAISAPTAGTVLRDVATGKPRWQFAAGMDTAAFSPDGRFVVVGGEARAIELWERASRGKRWEIATAHGAMTHVAFTAQGRMAITAHEDGTLLLWDAARMTAPAVEKPGKLTDKDLEKYWIDLASRDAVTAQAALVGLAARPGQALPLLKHRIAKLDDKLQDLPRWLDDLDHSQFKVREQATRKLEKLGKLAEPGLRKWLAGKPALEPYLRAEHLLARIEAADEEPPNTEWLHALRAVETLERIGNLEAWYLLQALATHPVETWVTAEARAALLR